MDKRQTSPDYDKLWLELALYVDQSIWEIFLNETDGNETEAMKKINGFMQGVMTIVNADYATFEIPIEIVVTELVTAFDYNEKSCALKLRPVIAITAFAIDLPRST